MARKRFLSQAILFFAMAVITIFLVPHLDMKYNGSTLGEAILLGLAIALLAAIAGLINFLIYKKDQKELDKKNEEIRKLKYENYKLRRKD